MKHFTIHYVFLILAGIFIGTIGLFVKLGGSAVNPFVLGFYRVFFAFLLLLIISPLIDKSTFKVKNKNLKEDALIGLLFAINFTGTNIAFLLAPIQNIALILSMTPIFVLIFAYFMLSEKITKNKVVTLIIALIGLVILNPLRPEGFWGNIIALFIVASGGFMFTLLRKINRDESIGNVFWFFLFATLFMLPFPLILGFGRPNMSIVSLGIISTGAAYLFYNLGYEKVEAEVGNMITNIVTPITAILFAFLVLDEPVYRNVLIGGGILVVAAVYLSTHIKRPHKIRHG